MRMLWLALMCMLFALPARGEEVVIGLSQDQVSISTDFDGSEILIFGAIKREAPIPEGDPLEVIITLAGPEQPLAVWRKERRFGIWVNTQKVEVDAAPSFYAVATSAPWHDAITHVEDLRHHISIERAIRSVGAPMDVEDSQSFSEAVVRIRESEDKYLLLEDSVQMSESTLFNTSITMPDNLVEGRYPMRIFLTRSGEVVSLLETTIDVRKVGLERWLYQLARVNPIAYGLLSLAIAIAAGWGASTAFRLLRSG